MTTNSNSISGYLVALRFATQILDESGWPNILRALIWEMEAGTVGRIESPTTTYYEEYQKYAEAHVESKG